ncbi:hypothetical protein PAMP_021718 [Pampus punctatissimus]
MNVALIHDRLHIKTFWEERINAQSQHADSEEQRMNSSALKKLVTQHVTVQHNKEGGVARSSGESNQTPEEFQRQLHQKNQDGEVMK